MVNYRKLDTTRYPEHLYLSRNIKALRELRGFSQEELSAKSGLSQSFISGVENLRSNASLEVICELARAFDVTVGELLSERIDRLNIR